LDAQVVGRGIEAARSGVEGKRRGTLAGVWVAFLLAILGFLVIYPVLTLLLGALTDTNPVVDGISLKHLSITNFLTVITNPNVGEALANTLIVCAGGTVIAVAIGLLFSWVVVRTNTPFRGLIATASILPLFAPPLVAGVAWSILGSPKTGLINTVFKWAGLGWHIDLYRCLVWYSCSASTTRLTSTCSPRPRCATWTRAWRRRRRFLAPARSRRCSR